MTSPSASPQSPGTDAPPDRKSTLFCPDCGHASSIDGDWDVRTTAGRRRLRCPECRRIVDRRATERRPARARTIGTPVQWYVDAVDRFRSAWTTLVVGDRSADC